MTNPSESNPPQPRKRRTRRKPAGPPVSVSAEVGTDRLDLVRREEPEERRSRLSIEEARASHELWRDEVLLYACLVAMAVLGLVSIAFLCFPGLSPDTKTWAAATLSSIVSGVVSYSVGSMRKAP